MVHGVFEREMGVRSAHPDGGARQAAKQAFDDASTVQCLSPARRNPIFSIKDACQASSDAGCRIRIVAKRNSTANAVFIVRSGKNTSYRGPKAINDIPRAIGRIQAPIQHDDQLGPLSRRYKILEGILCVIQGFDRRCTFNHLPCHQGIQGAGQLRAWMCMGWDALPTGAGNDIFRRRRFQKRAWKGAHQGPVSVIPIIARAAGKRIAVPGVVLESLHRLIAHVENKSVRCHEPGAVPLQQSIGKLFQVERAAFHQGVEQDQGMCAVVAPGSYWNRAMCSRKVTGR